jgi:AcrR family transcriptional regulator
VISERGIAATRIADVAERVGTSPPGVLYWFGSKDELLAEALTGTDERFYVAMTERLAELPDPPRRLRFMLEASADDYDWTLWMELWTRALRDEEAATARRRLDERWRNDLAAVIRSGQEKGDFGDADPDEVALVLASLVDGLAVQMRLADARVPREEMRRLSIAVAERLLGCFLPRLEEEGDGPRGVAATRGGSG